MSFRSIAVSASIFVLCFVGGDIAQADSICGPGKMLASNAWACVPEQRATISQPSSSNQTAAQIRAAAGILAIVGSLASQLTPTDNVGRADLDTEGHGTASREMNRSGFRNMQKGNFNRAALAFKLAAQEARKAQNWDEAQQNDKNWAIAVAHLHLQAAVKAETKGDISKASKAYHQAIISAENVGDHDLVAKLRDHHASLVQKASKTGKLNSTIPTDSRCVTVNGKMRCQ